MKQFNCRYCEGKGFIINWGSYSEYTDNPSHVKFERERIECEHCKGKGKVSAGIHFIQKTVIERDIPF